MRRLLIILVLTAITGCDRGEPVEQVPDPETPQLTQSAGNEEERVVQLAADILPKYREATDQIKNLNAYLTGRRKVLLKKEHQEYSERKDLHQTYSVTDHKNQSWSDIALNLQQRQAHLDREIAESDVVMKELSFAIRKLEKLENSKLKTQVNSLIESVAHNENRLESLSEIHFQTLTYLESLKRKLDELKEQLDTRILNLEAGNKSRQKNIHILEAAIEIELASFAAIAKREAQGEIIESMCGTTIQDSARRDIYKLKGQTIGAETAAFEIEYIQEAIWEIRSSLN